MDATAAPLQGWYVILPQVGARRAALTRRLRALGAHTVALPGLRIAPAADPAAADTALGAALAAGTVVFTSPAAVHHARALPAWRRGPRGQAIVIAIGKGTAAALRRAGVDRAQVPDGRGDSEAVLALPALAQVRGRVVGLVTAPGGRDRLAPALRARGAEVLRADVYRRLAPAPGPGSVRALLATTAPRAIMLSSQEALGHLLASLPAAARERLCDSLAVCASARLAEAAHAGGIDTAIVAADASPAALVAALRSHANHGAFR